MNCDKREINKINNINIMNTMIIKQNKIRN